MHAADALRSLIDPIELIADAADRISALGRASDLSAPVPALGRWKIADVIAHLGGVEEWAARVVSNRSTDGPGFRKSRLGGDELLDWFETVAAELVEVLRATDPDDDCPNFNPGSPNVVAFWTRRQLHEHLVHAFDVERAAAREPTPIHAEVAADGIDEYLDVFVRTRGKQTLAAPLRLACTDVDREWTLVPAAKSGRIDVADAASQDDAPAAMSGPAMTLLLVLWRRIPADALVVDGDAAVAASFRS